MIASDASHHSVDNVGVPLPNPLRYVPTLGCHQQQNQHQLECARTRTIAMQP
jgi:hypothetical protein|eukprot:SAG25_NODE_537_length_7103_cov_96.595231_6_plen_52_part_00